MRRKAFHNLRFALVLLVFFIMLFTQFAVGFMFFVCIRLGLVYLSGGGGKLYIFFLLTASIFLGTGITGIAGKRVLLPIRRLIQAMEEVAKGNFNIQVEAFGEDEFSNLMRSFNKMVKELNGVEIMRNDFVTSISHEFKTPLSSIQGYATLLQDDDLSHAERREYSDMIIAATRQLSSLSGNILKLSKLENQGIISEKTEFELDEQIRQTILLLEPDWNEKKIELDIEMEPIRYTGSMELLQHVWFNLLDNAIKFTPEGGTVNVTLSTSQNTVTVKISDNGIGMSQDTVKRIFDKFFQGDRSRSSEGNGLGLALVKRIVTLSGGQLTVNSELGKGSDFTVELPIREV